MAAICGASKKGDTVIVARNVHCSVNNALFLNELNPVYIYPEIDEIGICTGITRESVRAALEEHPEACEVIITSPTYEGVVSDIKGIAEETHRFGAVLIVDEAHGAHFNFHDKFPESAVKCGADAVIQSIHKTLPSFTQTALLHLNGNLIDKDRVKKYWNIYQSTSPSYILMAGISRCLTFLEDDMCDSVSSGYMDEYVFRLTNLRKEIKKLKYIKLQEVDDISKIVLVVNDGKNLYDKLLNEDQKEKEEKLEIFIPNGPRLGNKVIEAKGVAKAYGDKLLFDNLNFMLPPNGIVGVIGPNGAGKTTLFRLIMGLETVDKGTFEVGETVKLAYVDQQHKDIDANKTVYQVISGGNELIRMGGRDINARAYLSRFNFSGADQEKLCGMLSGGERNRLHLAMALKEEGNVLLLDEPTNDIDVNTLRALEEGLDDFAGTVIAVSHDRWFLDRICTHILAFEGNSEVFFFEGSYSEYEENKMKRLGNEEPKRVRYRKLMED